MNAEVIEELISKLTIEEKFAMIHGAGLFRTDGVKRLNIPPLKMSDGPIGVRNEFPDNSWVPVGNSDDYVTYLPCSLALAATWNRELAYKSGQVLGSEARGRGKDVILGPGINIIRSPLCGRNFEYMSEDLYVAAQMAVPFIKGVQENDVSVCVKHFAVNNQETERLNYEAIVDDRTLREIYLPAFEAAVKEGQINEEVIDDKIRRILRLMDKLNMFCENRKRGNYNAPEHRQVTLDTARESIVLLKNDNIKEKNSEEQLNIDNINKYKNRNSINKSRKSLKKNKCDNNIKCFELDDDSNEEIITFYDGEIRKISGNVIGCWDFEI